MLTAIECPLPFKNKVICIVHTYLFRTSERTQRALIRKKSRWTQYEEKLLFIARNIREHINMQCGQNAEILALNMPICLLNIRV